MARASSALRDARERGSHRAQLQYPQIDLARCLGCGTCVRACPEEGVLDLLHGQAIVVHGARCVGHGLCAEECPTGAIAVSLGDIAERRDIPVLDEGFESPQVPNLFLAGEVTGFALIRTAIAHGTAIASEVARRLDAEGRPAEAWDLVIVGAGPAGIACSLEAKKRGLRFLTLEQERLGGTVAHYPRRKLVMTQPVELPLHGRIDRTSIEKEELIALWERIASEHDLPIRTGVRFEGLERHAGGELVVHTDRGDVLARHVCLALGRRGTPRKLGVPGEDASKVVYALLDARSYTGRRILVVGGGDSAVEAALALADQDGNEVTLSYRRPAFFRLKARNESRLAEAQAAGRLRLWLESEVVRILPDGAELRSAGDPTGAPLVLPNDDVFVLAGGVPPFELLAAAGVSFDPADRPEPEPAPQRGSELRTALLTALTLASCAGLWTWFFRSYYALPMDARPGSRWHGLLRPSGSMGLFFGLGSLLFVAANLAYLVRRSPRFRVRLGSLAGWMWAHVVTGILAFVLALLHAALAPRDTVGGHAMVALGVLALTGAIGRHVYAFVPRAANGRELEFDEVQRELATLAGAWDRTNREFGERVRGEVQALAERGHWGVSLPRRLWALLSSSFALRRTLGRLEAEGRARGIAPAQLAELFPLARRAQRAMLGAAHFEDLRALLSSWRWFHRWMALVLVLLLSAHVVTALWYGERLG